MRTRGEDGIYPARRAAPGGTSPVHAWDPDSPCSGRGRRALLLCEPPGWGPGTLTGLTLGRLLPAAPPAGETVSQIPVPRGDGSRVAPALAPTLPQRQVTRTQPPTVCDAPFACVGLWPDPPRDGSTVLVGKGVPTNPVPGGPRSTDVVERIANICCFRLNSSNNDGGITPSWGLIGDEAPWGCAQGSMPAASRPS